MTSRKQVYEFFTRLVSDLSPEEQAAVLMDILVNDFCFQGVREEYNIIHLEDEIRESLRAQGGERLNTKIACIKKVRQELGLSLLDSKLYVESLMPGGEKFNPVKQAEKHEAYLALMLEEIAAKYRRGRADDV